VSAVEVDVETERMLKIIRSIAVDNVALAINPLILHP
jgi:hypothetical protein